MIKSERLSRMLDKYGLDLDAFLDMKDLWDGLKQAEKVKLIDDFSSLYAPVSGNPSNISKPNYENAHFNGEVD